jgi:RNA polymerase sigma factor (sigma-70 family)
VRRYAGMVFNVCLQILKDTHDAEDATQAVFLTLAVQAKTADGVKYIGPWLQRVAQRLSLDIKRSKTRRKAREERHGALTVARNGDNVPDHGHQIDMDEIKSVLRDELDKLPAKYRLPLILHYFGGLKPDDMAKELGCKSSTLGVRLHRGRKMLAESLASRGVVVSGSILALALAEMIQSTVSEHLIHATGHAAAHLAMGHSISAAGVSPQVLAFNRIASTSLTMARLKAAITAGILIAGAVAGAAQVVTHTYSFDGGIGLTGQLRSWLAPLLRSLSRPLQASANTAEAPAEVTLANDLISIPEKSLISDPWLNMPRPTQISPNASTNVIAPPAVVPSPSAGTTSSPAVASARIAPSSAFVLPLPRSDASIRAPIYSGSAWTSPAPQPVANSSTNSIPLPPMQNADLMTFGARQGESVSFDFDRPITYSARQVVVGDHGIATVNQSAGKVNVAQGLTLGKSADGTGTYNLSGKSELTAGTINVGESGAGKVVQNAPAVANAQVVAIASTSHATGAYDLHGGALHAEKLDVGVNGGGEFNQSGGSATAHGVRVAVGSGSKGVVNLSDGTLAAQDQVIGNVGDGRFLQTGGINKTSSLKIGSSGDSYGDYALTGGKIELQRNAMPSAPAAQIVVGSNSDGTFQLGDQHETGIITENGDGAPTSLVIRGRRAASGTFRGWGQVQLSGMLDDNGKVIAEGFGANRTLDLSAIGSVTNTIDNPTEGSNGWFASNGGKLVLPPLKVQPGTRSYAWGESESDGEPDLVNSLRISLHDVTKPGPASLALAASDRSDLPEAPVGYKLLSIWEADFDQVDPSSVDLLIRYDGAADDAPGFDAAIQLLTFTDSWNIVDASSAWVDAEGHLLYANGLAPASIYAVAIAQSPDLGVPTPEPGAALITIGVAGALLARRRSEKQKPVCQRR